MLGSMVGLAQSRTARPSSPLVYLTEMPAAFSALFTSVTEELFSITKPVAATAPTSQPASVYGSQGAGGLTAPLEPWVVNTVVLSPGMKLVLTGRSSRRSRTSSQRGQRRHRCH